MISGGRYSWNATGSCCFRRGVRYFDYMRNHTYNLLKGGFRDLTETDVAAGALFLPVSLDAMNNNPKVKQTAYWVGKF